eukprot:759549-Hanusia_phi.AAC.4
MLRAWQLASAVQGLGSKAVETLVSDFPTLPALLDFCRRCRSLESFKTTVTWVPRASYPQLLTSWAGRCSARRTTER